MRVYEKLSFPEALAALGLRVEFIAFCRTGASEQQVHEWVRARPDLVSRAFIPVSFKSLRKRLDCRAPHGGRRPAGKPFYSVQPRCA